MDERTVAYFDYNTPEYSVRRLNYAMTIINRYRHEQSSLVDIGCGTGNILEFIRNETGLQNLSGIDVSRNCLLKAQERVNCHMFLGSILDSNFIERIPKRFDFALLSAVLHHLIGKNRKESRDRASLAILNCLKLLKSKGHLIIIEPIFYPSIAMDVIFHIKKFFAKVSSRRIHILSRSFNIGAPVVSYFTNEQLIEVISRSRNCQIVETEIKEKKLSSLYRLALIKRRTETTVVVRKTSY